MKLSKKDEKIENRAAAAALELGVDEDDLDKYDG